MTRGRSSPGDPEALLKRVAEGSPGALDRLLAAHRQELLDYVRLRLSRQLSARLDPSDVVQEVQLTVAQRIDDYLQRRPMPSPPKPSDTTCHPQLALQRPWP